MRLRVLHESEFPDEAELDENYTPASPKSSPATPTAHEHVANRRASEPITASFSVEILK